MNHEQAFLAEMIRDYNAAPVMADWLEEQGDPRGEVLRLTHSLWQSWEITPERKAWERRLQHLLAAGVKPVVPTWTNSLGMTFAWIPPGSFLMGSPPEEPGRRREERQHRVTLTKGFFLGIHQVTQAQWQDRLKENLSHQPGPDRPVDFATYDTCYEFCVLLRVKDDRYFRLPTEAEWEYACRAGTASPYHFGDIISPNLANYQGRNGIKSRGELMPVGSFASNAWGLHDMHGNVFEWCMDPYGEYVGEDVRDPLATHYGQLYYPGG